MIIHKGLMVQEEVRVREERLVPRRAAFGAKIASAKVNSILPRLTGQLDC